MTTLYNIKSMYVKGNRLDSVATSSVIPTTSDAPMSSTTILTPAGLNLSYDFEKDKELYQTSENKQNKLLTIASMSNFRTTVESEPLYIYQNTDGKQVYRFGDTTAVPFDSDASTNPLSVGCFKDTITSGLIFDKTYMSRLILPTSTRFMTEQVFNNAFVVDTLSFDDNLKVVVMNGESTSTQELAHSQLITTDALKNSYIHESIRFADILSTESSSEIGDKLMTCGALKDSYMSSALSFDHDGIHTNGQVASDDKLLTTAALKSYTTEPIYFGYAVDVIGYNADIRPSGRVQASSDVTGKLLTTDALSDSYIHDRLHFGLSLTTQARFQMNGVYDEGEQSWTPAMSSSSSSIDALTSARLLTTDSLRDAYLTNTLQFSYKIQDDQCVNVLKDNLHKELPGDKLLTAETLRKAYSAGPLCFGDRLMYSSGGSPSDLQLLTVSAISSSYINSYIPSESKSERDINKLTTMNAVEGMISDSLVDTMILHNTLYGRFKSSNISDKPTLTNELKTRIVNLFKANLVHMQPTGIAVFHESWPICCSVDSVDDIVVDEISLSDDVIEDLYTGLCFGRLGIHAVVGGEKRWVYIAVPVFGSSVLTISELTLSKPVSIISKFITVEGVPYYISWHGLITNYNTIIRLSTSKVSLLVIGDDVMINCNPLLTQSNRITYDPNAFKIKIHEGVICDLTNTHYSIIEPSWSA